MENEDINKKTFTENSNTEDNYFQVLQSLNKLEKENNLIGKKASRLEEENQVLQELFNNANQELSNLKKPALLISEIISTHEDKAVIKLPNGNRFYSYVSKDVKELFPGDTVLIDQKSLNVVAKIDSDSNYEVEKYIIIEKPKENWKNIGGLKKEVQELKEVIELPLKSPELFEKVGIQPPKGILLHGPPGTGKTLLAKAVAHSTEATFIEVVGSELVQKFIGEGAKLVKDIFTLAKTRAPSIVFIDEMDAIAATRVDLGTSGEREVNRTFMQLLAELDGFKHLDRVKIIGATNRIDILDTAILRPGRLDRLIEVGLPNSEGLEEIFKIHSSRMNLKRVNIKEIVKEMDGLSGAEIRGICTEAGYLAIRNNRDFVTQNDFLQSVKKIRQKEEEDLFNGFG